jgi:hypothetical protein
MKQQEGGLFVAAAFPDHVVVVKDDNDWCLKCGQLVDQDRHQIARDVRELNPKSPENLIAAEAWAGSLQCVHQVPPQSAEVIVTVVKGDPSERPVLRCTGPPLRHESGFPGSRWSLNEDKLGVGASQHAD